jgi:hypothetical protein
MFKQPFVSFCLAGVDITDFGLVIPSPFCSLSISNAQISSFLSWELKVTVVGDDRKRSNIAAFEALLYSAAQDASKYPNSSGIPVSFMFGWINQDGTVGENVSYQGFTLKFSASTSGLSMSYTITGYASIGMKSAMPVYHIPSLCGIVQPSAVMEGLCHALKVDRYYDLDIDHNDAPTLVNHGHLTTSFTSYVRGTYSAEDDYTDFPGLLKLSKSYSATREAAGLVHGCHKLSTLMNNLSVSPISKFLNKSIVDSTPQCSAFSMWVDEPTMTKRGVIHYKSNAGLVSTHLGDTLEYGTANTNIISLNGSYNGVAYNMTNMNYSDVGFSVDGSGNTIVQAEKVVNSWSASLADVYQSVNIINDVNALASQFSGDFTIEIPGTTKQFALAQPISLLVVAGNSISPVTGVYNIVSVSHRISNTFTTTLKVQRLVMSSANEVASSQGITIANSTGYNRYSYTQTRNIKSTGKVEFEPLYPTYEDVLVV